VEAAPGGDAGGGGGQRGAVRGRGRSTRGVAVRPLPRLPGGALLGCAAGFLNVPKIKGSHTAIKSGMLAAGRPSSLPSSAPLPQHGAQAGGSWRRKRGEGGKQRRGQGRLRRGVRGGDGGAGEGQAGAGGSESPSVPSDREVDEALGRYPEALREVLGVGGAAPCAEHTAGVRVGAHPRAAELSL